MEYFEDPCQICIVGMMCKKKCHIYSEAVEYISRNLGRWDSQTIRKFRQNSTAEFKHAVENETKRRVAFNKEHRIREI